ncbi:hypothetical protein CPS_4939 [Colwellia psychrerythraea 34H]|uniref:Uncharacterized protein n=1 Tax=Colwellia psychrerythraea (strain 34H / ATCC BAA-681) TaxID=167879 RepID=Q47UE5_COLP3|nr:hypothetical protein CPS_4939 [Colwellia psychrerythraea 34H]
MQKFFNEWLSKTTYFRTVFNGVEKTGDNERNQHS